MTYKEAQKSYKKVGTACAAGDGLQAIYAEALAFRLALRPETVYVWAKRHGVDLSVRHKDFIEIEKRPNLLDFLLADCKPEDYTSG